MGPLPYSYATMNIVCKTSSFLATLHLHEIMSYTAEQVHQWTLHIQWLGCYT